MSEKDMVVRSLMLFRECPEKERLSSLRLTGLFESERRRALLTVLSEVKSSLKHGEDMDSTLAVIRKLGGYYKKEWFTVPAAYESAVEKDAAKLKRMVSYICNLPAKVVDTSVPFKCSFQGLSYKGRELENIYGRADIVLQYADGHFEGICLSTKAPVYSYRARKPENMVENSPELILMKLGLEERYPGITCSIYSLKGKDDTGTEFPAFEYRQGKNIVSSSFKNYTFASLGQHFLDVLDYPVEKDCESCPYATLCSIEQCEQIPLSKRAVKTGGKKPELTAAQTEVVHHMDGPMNVIAVPGAGKTFSLVQRMLFLMQQGVSPKNMLFVTYTRKACEEIKERIQAALGTKDAEKLPNIFTFNALGYQILKENAALLGRRVKLADDVKRLELIRDVLAEQPKLSGMSYDGMYMKPNGLLFRLFKEFEKIKDGKEEWMERTKVADKEGVLSLYNAYLREFEKRGFVSYDEQISLCNELFASYPGLSRMYAKVFTHIMVDEFQDVSADNARLVYSIAKHHGNIVVVGDDDQSIFSFRGGTNRFLIHFPDEFPDARTVIMNDNYRSDGRILAVSDALMADATESRIEKSVRSHRDGGMKPLFIQNFRDEQIMEIVQDVLNRGYRLEDIAILSRNNKPLFHIADVLSSSYPVSRPKAYLVDDPAFQMVYDCMKVYFLPDEADASLYRMLIRMGIDATDIEKRTPADTLLSNLLKKEGLPDIYECSDGSAFHGADTPLGTILCRLYDALGCIRNCKDISTVIGNILKITVGITRSQTAEILSEMADEQEVDTCEQLFRLMEDMVLFRADTRVENSPHGIQCLTAHDAKGKEFPVVLIYAVEEFGESEEDRRLLYVALTRAKKILVVTESMYERSSLLSENCLSHMAVRA